MTEGTGSEAVTEGAKRTTKLKPKPGSREPLFHVEHFYRQQEPYRWEGIKPTVKAEKPQENHRENQLFLRLAKKLEKKLRKKRPTICKPLETSDLQAQKK